MAQKQLKIKTGVLSRSVKEFLSYGKEKDQQEAKISKLRADGADEADIKKQNEVLEETLAMLPDCKRRIGTAHADLKKLVDANADDGEVNSSAEFEAAKKALEDAEPHVN